MERYFDDLSKRLAKAVSRREMLTIASRTLLSTFFASSGLEKVWAQSPYTSAVGDIGSSTCGAVQKSIQLAFPESNRYTNHGQYISAIAQFTTTAEDEGFITAHCGGCIISQFAEVTTIPQQQNCGFISMPTQSCASIGTTAAQIKTAAILALAAAPNPFGDPTEFLTWTNLTQEILGCLIAPSSPTSLATSVSRDADTCAVTDVSYCGPGNSVLPTIPGLPLPMVASCVNEQCCIHDNCYAQICESGTCYFTPQTTACDAPLLAACMGQGCSSSDLEIGWTPAVCAIVTCLVQGSNIETSLSSLCLAIQTQRLSLSPECSTPCNGSCCTSGTDCVTATTVVPGSIVGVCCPPNSTVCGDSCCASGLVCWNEQCVSQCPSGTTECGTTCCPPNQVCSGDTCEPCGASMIACGKICCSSTQMCSNGACIVSCASGTTACGTSCCSSSQTCTDGQCVTNCPSGTTLCGSQCCSSTETCVNGQCTDNCGCAPELQCFDGRCYPTCAVCTSELPVCCQSPVVGGPTGAQSVSCYPSGYTCCGSTGYACSGTRGETCCYNQAGGFSLCVGAGGSC